MTTYRVAGALKSVAGDQVVGPSDVDGLIEADSPTEALAFFVDRISESRNFSSLDSVTVEVYKGVA